MIFLFRFTWTLIVAKLHFFRYVASILRTFLTSYQTDSPMMPFISSDLYSVMERLMNVIILKEVLDREVTPYKLINLDLSKNDIYLSLNSLNLGTATKLALQNPQVFNEWKTKFKKDCVVIIRNVIEKLQDRSPLKYNIVRYSASFSPVKMIQNKEECILKFKRLVEKLCEMKWISAVDADDSKLHYEEFLTSASSEYKNHFLD